MNHRIIVQKLSKTPAHRKAMLRNMLVALFREEKIKTTFAKAKVLRRFAEKLITRSATDSVHNRRMVARWVQDKAILNKLFTEIAPKYKKRPGGYTRIVKLGLRKGDASEMVYILLVEEETTQPVDKKKKTKSLVSNKQKVISDKNTADDTDKTLEKNLVENTTQVKTNEQVSTDDSVKETKNDTTEQTDKSEDKTKTQ